LQGTNKVLSKINPHAKKTTKRARKLISLADNSQTNFKVASEKHQAQVKERQHNAKVKKFTKTMQHKHAASKIQSFAKRVIEAKKLKIQTQLTALREKIARRRISKGMHNFVSKFKANRVLKQQQQQMPVSTSNEEVMEQNKPSQEVDMSGFVSFDDMVEAVKHHVHSGAPFRLTLKSHNTDFIFTHDIAHINEFKNWINLVRNPESMVYCDSNGVKEFIEARKKKEGMFDFVKFTVEPLQGGCQKNPKGDTHVSILRYNLTLHNPKVQHNDCGLAALKYILKLD